jgi:hypothetical protein
VVPQVPVDLAAEAKVAMRVQLHLERVSQSLPMLARMARLVMRTCILAEMETAWVVVFRRDARRVWIKPAMQFYQ